MSSETFWQFRMQSDLIFAFTASWFALDSTWSPSRERGPVWDAPGLRKKSTKADPVDALINKVTYLKASVRVKDGASNSGIKRQFGRASVRCLGD